MAKFKFELILSKREAVGVRNTLQKIYKTIQDPKKWIKGSYEEEEEPLDNTTYTTYCLIGAVRHVDGTWEDLTHVFMVSNLPKGFDDYIDLYLDTEMGDLIKECTLVEGFNDNKATTHKKVLAWLTSLIAKADKIAKSPKKKKAGK